MSFFDAYEGTERIPLGGIYWADVKKSLTGPEYGRVQANLGAGKQTINASAGAQLLRIDPEAAQYEMLFQAIQDWNLDDRDGVLPLEPEAAKRASIRRLPASVLMEVYKFCDELYGPRKGDEAARFPDDAVGGDPDGDDPAG